MCNECFDINIYNKYVVYAFVCDFNIYVGSVMSMKLCFHEHIDSAIEAPHTCMGHVSLYKKMRGFGLYKIIPIVLYANTPNMRHLEKSFIKQWQLK